MNQSKILQYAIKGITDSLEVLYKKRKLNAMCSLHKIDKEIKYLEGELEELNIKLFLEGRKNE